MIDITSNCITFTPDYSLATLSPVNPVCCPSAPKKKCAQKEETTMDYNMEVDQRNHLKRRLDRVETDKHGELRTAFHMDASPKSKDAILAALKAGNIEFNNAYFAKDGTLGECWNANGTFSFVDPDKDEKGYDAAKKLLHAAFAAAKDKIIVLPLKDGLDALNEFEAATF